MMIKVTQEGTAAGLTVGGAPFAGKTGTAEIDIPNGINQPWFIGFAPANDPKVAVAVTLERCKGCFGGEVAGPIATTVMDGAWTGASDGSAAPTPSSAAATGCCAGIGAGGMADVWCADDQMLDRQVALKFLLERYAEDQQFVERFRREAAAAAGLQHPNIVSVYDRGEHEGARSSPWSTWRGRRSRT